MMERKGDLRSLPLLYKSLMLRAVASIKLAVAMKTTVSVFLVCVCAHQVVAGPATKKPPRGSSEYEFTENLPGGVLHVSGSNIPGGQGKIQEWVSVTGSGLPGTGFYRENNGQWQRKPPSSLPNPGFPVDNGGYPDGNGGFQGGGGVTGNNGGVPGNNGGYPGNNGRYPGNNGGYPNNNGGYPGNNGDYPNNNGGPPANNGVRPGNNGRRPDRNGGYPDNNDGYGSYPEESPQRRPDGRYPEQTPTRGYPTQSSEELDGIRSTRRRTYG